MCFARRSELENDEVDLQKKQNFVSLFSVFDQFPAIMLREIRKEQYKCLTGGTKPYGSSYKQFTTRFRWTILTEAGLTVAGRPKPHGSSH